MLNFRRDRLCLNRDQNLVESTGSLWRAVVPKSFYTLTGSGGWLSESPTGMVMLKASPWEGVIHFSKRGKLNPRYIRSFKILARVGTLDYRLELPEQLSQVHSTFRVSNLKKCFVNEPLAIPLDEIHMTSSISLKNQLKLWIEKLNG
ncbi:hypothetical protein Tco_0666518 [Tanacetum coccineum]